MTGRLVMTFEKRPFRLSEASLLSFVAERDNSCQLKLIFFHFSKGHCQGLRGLASHPSSQTFITGGSDKTVQLWNAADRRTVWKNNKLVSFAPKWELF